MKLLASKTGAISTPSVAERHGGLDQAVPADRRGHGGQRFHGGGGRRHARGAQAARPRSSASTAARRRSTPSKPARCSPPANINGFVIGCLGVEVAARALHKQEVPKELIVKPAIYDKDNFQKYQARVDMKECPTLAEEETKD